MTNAEKLDLIHYAIQEALNNNLDELASSSIYELDIALGLLEELRELETNRGS